MTAIKRSSHESRELALRQLARPGGAGKLKAFVESGWDNLESIEAASQELVDFMHRSDIFSALGEPIDVTSLKVVEEMATSVAGRSSLFPADGKWTATPVDAAGRLGKLLEALDSETLKDWLRIYSEDLARAAVELEEREAIEEVLYQKDIRFYAAKEPRLLSKVARAISAAGGAFYLMPLLRMALRDGYAVAFCRRGLGFEVAVPTDWLDIQMPSRSDESWRFIFTETSPQFLETMPTSTRRLVLVVGQDPSSRRLSIYGSKAKLVPDGNGALREMRCRRFRWSLANDPAEAVAGGGPA